MSIIEMMRDLDKIFTIQVSKNTCYRAKVYVLHLIIGYLSDHYKLFPSYMDVLKGSIRMVCLSCQLKEVLVYVMLLSKGFMLNLEVLELDFYKGCIRVISLNGCFLKTKADG